MSDKYGVGNDPDCYPGTAVLKNKLGIKDARLLEEAEAEFAATAAETIEIEAPPFNLDYLCSLHRQLFDEVYEWAGDIRLVDISKGQTRFCIASRVVPEAEQVVLRLMFDDARNPEFELAQWNADLPASTGSPSEALRLGRRWLSHVEALMKR